KEDKLRIQEEQIKKQKRQLKKKEDEQKRREYKLRSDAKQITEEKRQLVMKEKQLRTDKEQITEWKRQCEGRQYLLRSDTELMGRVNQLRKQEKQIKELKRQLKEKEDDQKSEEDQLRSDAEQIKEWKRQLEGKENQLKTDKEQIMECNMETEGRKRQLEGREDQLRRDAELIGGEDQLRRDAELIGGEDRLRRDAERIGREDQLRRDAELIGGQDQLRRDAELIGGEDQLRRDAELKGREDRLRRDAELIGGEDRLRRDAELIGREDRLRRDAELIGGEDRLRRDAELIGGEDRLRRDAELIGGEDRLRRDAELIGGEDRLRRDAELIGGEDRLRRDAELIGGQDQLRRDAELIGGEDQLRKDAELKGREDRLRRDAELIGGEDRLRRDAELKGREDRLRRDAELIGGEDQLRKDAELIGGEDQLRRDAELIGGEDQLRKDAELIGGEDQLRKDAELIGREDCAKQIVDWKRLELEGNQLKLTLENEKQSREYDLRCEQEQINEWRKQLESKDHQLTEWNKNLHSREKDIMTRSNELKSQQEQINEWRKQLESKDHQLTEWNKNLCSKEKDIMTRSNELKSQQEQINEWRKQLESKDHQLTEWNKNLCSKEKDIMTRSNELKSQQEQMNEWRKQLESKDHQLTEWNKNLCSKEKDIMTRSNELKSQQEQMNEWRKQLESKDHQLTEWNKNLCSKEKDIMTREKRREIQLETIGRREDEINTLTKVIEHVTKMKQEKEEEMKKDEERMKEQVLQIERNCEKLKQQEEKLQKLKTDIHSMNTKKQREKQQVFKEKRWIEQENKALKSQWREIENEKEKIQRQERVNKEEIHRQEMEKLKNEEEIKTQTALIQKLKMEMNECEDTLERQMAVKQINDREIEGQTTQFKEQKIKIDTQKEEIDRQEREIQTNARIIKQTRRKKQTLERLIQTEEKQQQRKNENFQRQASELEKQKKQHEQNVSLIRLKEKRNKYREVRRREEDLQILQDFLDQLDNRLSSPNYMQDCNIELDLREELGKIIEKMKTELQRSSEELEVLKNTWEDRKKRKDQESSKKDNPDDVPWDAASSIDDKVFEENLSQRTFNENMQDPDSEDIRKSTLQSFLDILQYLSLDHFYPNKLTIESVLTIGSPREKQLKNNLAFNYLQKLLMMNYQVRFVTEKKDHKDFTMSARTGGNCDRKEDIDGVGVSDATNNDASNYRPRGETITTGMPQSVCETEAISYDHLDEFLSEKSVFNNAKEKEKIHPMDIQMAVFHCADSFLRQYMMTKLSSCQYALPLLVPNPISPDIELPLWTLQQIKKTWRLADGSSKNIPVSQIKAPMVFFCRLGSVSTSKSQLLNSVINPKHDTFFHRHSPGSSRNRLFMEGLVEIAWYCPAGNNDDLFSECIAFCNLHGDAVEHRDQIDFLSEGATINVVLMQNMNLNNESRELLQKLHKSSKPLICLVSDLQKGPLKISQGLNVKIGLAARTRNDLQNELKSAIKTCLQKCHISCKFSLEESSALVKSFWFRVDENSRYCQEGKTRAEEVIKLLEGENLSEIKNKFMPCQGKLWHEWTRKNKQLHRLHGEMEHTRNVTLAEMNKIRMKQCGSNLRFMKSFVKNLLSNSKTQTRYFVQWTRYFIDARFSDQVSQAHLKYNSKWLEVQKLKNTQGKSEELKVLQKQLEEVSKELDTVTFGLEHIFREMGQIYEAWATLPEEIGTDVSAFPAVAADLLISGHPLELMDGDAAHVPLTWIESVLDKVTERLGDQRVFVLSVLGLQSTGKSTMLNAMFGLQFAVSAGRCTRGAFMQLMRVKDEDKDQLKFDYLLVVDTEGLQSLELAGKSTFSHDNELATFVMGIANMTLINIFGENPAEIQELFQIVIQAILRMKNVKLNPSCMFVHQNITDITTAEKNMEGRRRLQDKLDELISVAKEEGCDVECFNDVIKFNIQTDVHHFAPLWEGNPPMAPPNPRYSENAASLKQFIFKAAAQQKALTLSELKVRIKDLWTAVCDENFMFSFKNSLEFAFYRKKIASKH
ncbi:hypothetical protein MHYP_G00086900, partial [Metynnis hypsauchen]